MATAEALAARVLEMTMGRVTNEQMEQATAVGFKSEGCDASGEYGKVWLEVGDEVVPFQKPDEHEWHGEDVAQALADLLGVDVRWW